MRLECREAKVSLERLSVRLLCKILIDRLLLSFDKKLDVPYLSPFERLSEDELIRGSQKLPTIHSSTDTVEAKQIWKNSFRHLEYNFQFDGCP